MFKILTFNNISTKGLERLPRERYEVASEIQHPDGVLLRSYNLHNWEVPDSVKAIGRAGAGVNNIPVDKMNTLGVPVFNAPGANSNAVKELVISGLLLSVRNILPAWEYVSKLEGTDAEISKQVESGKKQFVGQELVNRSLGVIGLGAIGVKVANTARALGMDVIGYDPHITVKNAWQLDSGVQQASSVEDVLSRSEFVTLHVPLVDATRHLINADRLTSVYPNITILNFSRDGIVDNAAICDAIKDNRVKAYICDFPSNQLLNHERVIALPHLGASTQEAEENCAIMVADQVRDFLEDGTVTNAVNFPEMYMPRNGGQRLLVVNSNVPHMIERISKIIANANLNIMDMLNRSRHQIACTLVDVEGENVLTSAVTDEIAKTEGVLRVRVL